MSRKKKPVHPLIGQKIRFVPAYDAPMNGAAPRVMTGTVVWVHPKERFVLLEYDGQVTPWSKGGKLHECMSWHQIPGNKKCPAGVPSQQSTKDK